MRLLLVCTRDWKGRTVGRKTVLRTILTSLKRNGHTVQVVVLGHSEGTSPETCHFLGRPGWFAIAANLARRRSLAGLESERMLVLFAVASGAVAGNRSRLSARLCHRRHDSHCTLRRPTGLAVDSRSR